MTITCLAQAVANASTSVVAAHSAVSGGQGGYSLPAGFAFIGALLTLAALFSYVNVRFLTLPRTTALMLMSLTVSIVLYVLARAYVPLAEGVEGLVAAIPFRELLLDGLLGLTFSGRHILAGAIAVPVVLLARFVMIGVPVTVLRRWTPFAPHAERILTWGGLRGGISVALALSLPDGTGPQKAARVTLLAVTYFVVAFSIIVQGLTIGKLVRRAPSP
jgi:NhaP-type Na+/H+ or K+/H+ antiporter